MHCSSRRRQIQTTGHHHDLSPALISPSPPSISTIVDPQPRPHSPFDKTESQSQEPHFPCHSLSFPSTFQSKPQIPAPGSNSLPPPPPGVVEGGVQGEEESSMWASVSAGFMGEVERVLGRLEGGEKRVLKEGIVWWALVRAVGTMEERHGQLRCMGSIKYVIRS